MILIEIFEYLCFANIQSFFDFTLGIKHLVVIKEELLKKNLSG